MKPKLAQKTDIIMIKNEYKDTNYRTRNNEECISYMQNRVIGIIEQNEHRFTNKKFKDLKILKIPKK